MLIFIPPSETKAFPSGTPRSSSVPSRCPNSRRRAPNCVRHWSGWPAAARRPRWTALGLSEGQAGELAHNRELGSAPAGVRRPRCTPACCTTHSTCLPCAAAGVTTDHVLIFSGLWGVLRPGDRIPHYRCSAGVKLPAVGSVSAAWRKALRDPLAAHVGDRLVVDLRSGAYAGLWAPGANAVTVRVLHERESGGVVKRAVVSHFNKATKGRLTRALLESGQQPRKPDEFADLVRELGYSGRAGSGGRVARMHRRPWISWCANSKRSRAGRRLGRPRTAGN